MASSTERVHATACDGIEALHGPTGETTVSPAIFCTSIFDSGRPPANIPSHRRSYQKLSVPPANIPFHRQNYLSSANRPHCGFLTVKSLWEGSPAPARGIWSTPPGALRRPPREFGPPRPGLSGACPGNLAYPARGSLAPARGIWPAPPGALRRPPGEFGLPRPGLSATRPGNLAYPARGSPAHARGIGLPRPGLSGARPGNLAYPREPKLLNIKNFV